MEGSYGLEQWENKLKEYNYCCAYCHQLLGDNTTADHVIPISRGGTNFIENIVPSCKKCNSRKYTKTAKEFNVKCQ